MEMVLLLVILWGIPVLLAEWAKAAADRENRRKYPDWPQHQPDWPQQLRKLLRERDGE